MALGEARGAKTNRLLEGGLCKGYSPTEGKLFVNQNWLLHEDVILVVLGARMLIRYRIDNIRESQ